MKEVDYVVKEGVQIMICRLFCDFRDYDELIQGIFG